MEPSSRPSATAAPSGVGASATTDAGVHSMKRARCSSNAIGRGRDNATHNATGPANSGFSSNLHAAHRVGRTTDLYGRSGQRRHPSSPQSAQWLSPPSLPAASRACASSPPRRVASTRSRPRGAFRWIGNGTPAASRAPRAVLRAQSPMVVRAGGFIGSETNVVSPPALVRTPQLLHPHPRPLPITTDHVRDHRPRSGCRPLRPGSDREPPGIRRCALATP